MSKYPYAVQQSADELGGMASAETYFANRPQLSAEMCRLIGRNVYERGKRKNEARAGGFRQMAYIVSQESGRQK